MSFTAEEQRKAFAGFQGQKVTVFKTGKMVSDPSVFMMHFESLPGLSEKPNTLHTGSNSGYQAINLAVLAGAKRILLLGYDMRFQGAKSHSHNGHPVKHSESAYTGYARNFASMVPQLQRLGVEVINCSPSSAIGCFPRMPLEQAL